MIFAASIALTAAVLLSWGAMPLTARACILDNSLTQEMLWTFPEGTDPGEICLVKEPLRQQKSLGEFYRPRHFGSVWISDLGLSDQAKVLLDAIRTSAAEGLEPTDYHLGPIEQLIQYRQAMIDAGNPFHPSYQAVLDLLLTDAFFSLGLDNTLGRTPVAPGKTGFHGARPRPELGDKLLDGLRRSNLKSVLSELMPDQPEYLALKSALERYRGMMAAGDWPRVPEGPSLHPGDASPRVNVLKQRLARGGDLRTEFLVPGDVFDGATQEAVKSFQRLHGLEADGVVGAKTLAELNVPLARRVRQIELNMERWRSMPRTFGERSILVNIAGFWLQVKEGRNSLLEMPVIVGREARKTPVFSDRISHVIFGPYWNVPPTILREDVLPAIRKNANYLEMNNLEIIRYQGGKPTRLDPLDFDWKTVRASSFNALIRQRPGPQNSLGLVKFFIQNTQSIYLHDTPKKEYFEKQNRSLSSGCIRVGKPLELAEYLLRGQQNWDMETIAKAMEEEKNKWIPLNRSIPVYIQYWTSWVDAEGNVQFRPDIYGHDRELDLAVRQRFSETGDAADAAPLAGESPAPTGTFPQHATGAAGPLRPEAFGMAH